MPMALKKSKIPSALLFVFLILTFSRPALAKLNVDVKIEGIKGELKKNVLNLLAMQQQKNAPEFDETTMRALYKQAPGEITNALAPFGYYTPDIKSSLTKNDGKWTATFNINPGPPVIVSGLSFQVTGEGKDLEAFKNIEDRFALKKGSILDQRVYEAAKKDLQQTAAGYGFFKADMAEHRIDVYPDKHQARIFLHFDTGPRYKFGKTVYKQDILSQKLLKRYIFFKRGDPFDVSKTLELQSALTQSGYFEDVQVTPRQDMATGLEVPVDVALTPSKRYHLTFGAGYGTDTGLRGSLTLADTRINRRGHKADLTIAASQISRDATARYVVPGPNPATDNITYSAGFQTIQTNTYKAETIIVGPSYNRMLSKFWTQLLFINFQREHFNIDEESTNSKLIIPGGTWTYRKAQESYYGGEGFRFTGTVQGAQRLFLSDDDLAQIHLQPKFVQGTGYSARIILRAEAGATAVSDFYKFPATLRFFAGGDNSIRGYSYQSLGPVDQLGNTIGGKFLFVVSAEYEHRVYGKWSASVFYDGGNAFNNIPFHWYSGIGTGVIWRSPLGPIRVDFAWEAFEHGPRFHVHINIGPAL